MRVWLPSSDKEGFCLLLMGLHFRGVLYNKNQGVADLLRLDAFNSAGELIAKRRISFRSTFANQLLRIFYSFSHSLALSG